MNIKVYDDFLEPDVFDFVQRHMLGDMFPWKYATVLNPEEDDLLCDQIDNVQFSQWLYKDFIPTGPEFDIVKPIVLSQDLEITALRRIKANMTMRTPEIIKHGFHTDGFGDFQVAIYYVNTNDGYTEFEDGTKVESVENRLVVFSSRLKHTGTTCTNEKVRCVINFNYYSVGDEN
jgi:hypothetical protein